MPALLNTAGRKAGRGNPKLGFNSWKHCRPPPAAPPAFQPLLLLTPPKPHRSPAAFPKAHKQGLPPASSLWPHAGIPLPTDPLLLCWGACLLLSYQQAAEAPLHWSAWHSSWLLRGRTLGAAPPWVLPDPAAAPRVTAVCTALG